MAQVNLTLDGEVLKGLFTADGKDEALSGLLNTILNQVLNAQASEQVGAERRMNAAKTGGHTVTGIGNGS